MWKPLNETYFVRPDPIEVSKLVLEEYKKEHVQLMSGTVVAVGTGTLLENGHRTPLQLREGQKVQFGPKVGADINVNGEKLLLVAEGNLIAYDASSTEV